MAVLKKAKVVSVMDRRTDVRVPWLFITQAVRLTAPDRTKFDIECINISKGGLAFRSRIALQPGEHVVVKMQFCNRDGQVWLCEVRHCDEEAPGHRVGVLILDSISAPQGEFDIPEKWLPQA